MSHVQKNSFTSKCFSNSSVSSSPVLLVRARSSVDNVNLMARSVLLELRNTVSVPRGRHRQVHEVVACVVVCMPAQKVRFCEWGRDEQTSADNVFSELKKCCTILGTEVIQTHSRINSSTLICRQYLAAECCGPSGLWKELRDNSHRVDLDVPVRQGNSIAVGVPQCVQMHSRLPQGSLTGSSLTRVVLLTKPPSLLESLQSQDRSCCRVSGVHSCSSQGQVDFEHWK